MQVKADSIWFQDRKMLAKWQELKTGEDPKAMAIYQVGLLRSRQAWQFIEPQQVKIRGYRRALHQVDVEMQSEGRLQGKKWILDADAVTP